PGRAAGVHIAALLPVATDGGVGVLPRVVSRRCPYCAPRLPALPVEFGGLGVVEEDVRRPATGGLPHFTPRPLVEPRQDGTRSVLAVRRHLVRGCGGFQFSGGGVPAKKKSVVSARATQRLARRHPAPVDVQCPGAALQDVGRDGPGEGLTGAYDWLEARLERRAPALPTFGVGRQWSRVKRCPVSGAFVVGERRPERCSLIPASLGPGRLVDGLGHVEGLREPIAVQPRDAVADLEPGVLDGARETVPRAGPAEREQVPARLEDSQA